MLTAVLLTLAAQTPASPGAPPPADDSKFSETFKRRRAWEKAQLEPSWTDHLAFAVAGYGGAHFFTDPSFPVSVAPGITIDLELGAHLMPSVALVGTAQVRAAFLQPGTEMVLMGPGAGMRLGSKHSVTFGAGAVFVALMRVETSRSGFAPSLDVHGVFNLVGKFGLHFRAGLAFIPGAVIADAGVGFGFST